MKQILWSPAAILALGVPMAAQAASGLCPTVQLSDLSPLPAPAFANGPDVSVAGLRSDFERWLSDMREINPDVSLRADEAGMSEEALRIRSAMVEPMNAREAWALFARINPFLRDGHSGIAIPESRQALQAHVSSGGHLLPFEVRFAGDGSLQILTPSIAGAPFAQGNRLLSVNGVVVETLVREMLARTPGETDRFRRALLARRFAAYYYFLYGDTGSYDIEFADRNGCVKIARVEGATRLPTPLQPAPTAEDIFAARILPGRIGYLRVDSFAYEEREKLATFAAGAFAQFREANVRALIIDIRENGGGDDPLWQNSIMNYITTQSYAQLSRFAVRITRQNADPDDIIGNVQRAEFTRRITPQENLPDRFAGPVYILGGPFSYSATIQFMVAAQDFRIARIAGEETGALSCQTGQVRPIDLRHTGLFAFTPLIAYTRPSGEGCGRGVVPDVTVQIDEVYPDRTLDALTSFLRNNVEGNSSRRANSTQTIMVN